MSFIAYDVSLDAIRCLRSVIARIAAHDADLAAQLRRASTSTPLNLGEGRRRRGRDRTYHYRVAAGSAGESIAALDVALAAGYLADGDADANAARAHLDRVVALLWPLTR